MVVLFCSFKSNTKFAQKNRTGPWSLFCSFCVRKLDSFLHNAHTICTIRTKFEQYTKSEQIRTVCTIRTKFTQSEQNSHTLFNFEQIHINSHKITIIIFYLSYISDIYVYYNMICSYYIHFFLLYMYRERER